MCFLSERKYIPNIFAAPSSFVAKKKKHSFCDCHDFNSLTESHSHTFLSLPRVLLSVRRMLMQSRNGVVVVMICVYGNRNDQNVGEQIKSFLFIVFIWLTSLFSHLLFFSYSLFVFVISLTFHAFFTLISIPPLFLPRYLSFFFFPFFFPLPSAVFLYTTSLYPISPFFPHSLLFTIIRFFLSSFPFLLHFSHPSYYMTIHKDIRLYGEVLSHYNIEVIFCFCL